MLQLLIPSLIIIGLVFAGVGIRILFLKKGEFRGTCSTQNQISATDGHCSICGATAEEKCKSPA